MNIKEDKLLFGALGLILILVLAGNCSNSSKYEKLEKQVAVQDSLLKVVAARPENVAPLSEEQVRAIVSEESTESMYYFLQYEQALDNKEITLSQIKVREKVK